MYLEVLLRFELLAAHVAGHVLRLNGVHVHDVLLQVGIVRVDFPALRTLRLAGEIRGVCLVVRLGVIATVRLLVEQRHALDFLLRARLQHQVQLAFRRDRLLLLQALQIVLQLLVHDRELLGIEAVEGVEGVQGIEGVLLRRLAGGV